LAKKLPFQKKGLKHKYNKYLQENNATWQRKQKKGLAFGQRGSEHGLCCWYGGKSFHYSGIWLIPRLNSQMKK
jgi:hypothetical protein